MTKAILKEKENTVGDEEIYLLDLEEAASVARKGWMSKEVLDLIFEVTGEMG